MKKDNKNIKIAAIASGAVLLGTVNANATELLTYEDLGSGSELRSNLITADAMTAFTNNTDVEFECGEGKCGEGKCGEGKCGEKSDKKEKKSEKKSEVKAADKSDTKKTGEMKATSKETKEKKAVKATSEDPKN